MRFPTQLSALVLPVALLACTTNPGDQKVSAPTWGTPITGGTMIVSADNQRAIIADTDRDRIVIVNLADGTILANTALQANDEPGRLVEDKVGQVHVALRRGGAILQIDGHNGAIMNRRAVCAEPRGLAYDPATDHLHVACATGELVTFNAIGGDAIRSVMVERDLRDVVVNGTGLVVSTFRNPEMLNINADGMIATRSKLPTVTRFGSAGPLGGDVGAPPPSTPTNPDGTVNAIPTVAWRTIQIPDGRLVVTHQRQVQGELHTSDDGYSIGCSGGGPVEAAVSVVDPTGANPPTSVFPFAGGALPVDIAASPDRTSIAMISAGNQGITIVPTAVLDQHDDNDPCGGGNGGGGMGGGNGGGPDGSGSGGMGGGNGGGGDDGGHDNLGAPTSVAYSGTTATAGTLIVFYPEVPAIVLRDNDGHGTAKVIKLPGELGYDSGRNVFHMQTKSGLACASCHPEGRDDGQVWTFAGFGTRRTQNLAGGILARAPYHWTGDKPDLNNLMDDVFAVRMGGGKPTDNQKLAIGPWIDRLPAPSPLAGLDPAQVARGKALFESNTVQCTKCHNDELMTNNSLQDVGTGGTFKVPSLLGVSGRAPFMHNGCAATLTDRFNPACGGGDKHGLTSQLSPTQIADLVGYLESL